MNENIAGVYDKRVNQCYCVDCDVFNIFELRNMKEEESFDTLTI